MLPDVTEPVPGLLWPGLGSLDVAFRGASARLAPTPVLAPVGLAAVLAPSGFDLVDPLEPWQDAAASGFEVSRS